MYALEEACTVWEGVLIDKKESTSTDIPLGMAIHNIEITVGKGGQLARAAGAVAKLIAKEGKSSTLKLPCGEFRVISKNCSATVGQVWHVGLNQKNLGRFGSKRWLGKCPVVRGVVMNPVDHPHGGGEGSAPIGRKQPTTPWGYPALGKRSRKRNKYSDNMILRRRSILYFLSSSLDSYPMIQDSSKAADCKSFFPSSNPGAISSTNESKFLIC
ncbi:unnamed protein product [Lactuca saligna]|uniref:Large ribosomal subunit protein uL2 C-terminal domain-containing protein n=1 Tax=Lactuca saligna TaxID=75948 RepID=A0AA36E0I4_LACSI|nr:unnamed protein product [Lactuca saligna]